MENRIQGSRGPARLGPDCPVYAMPVATFTLPPHRHTNSFLVGSREFCMVDAGALDDEAVQALLDFLRRQGGASLSRLLLTHWHPDHRVGVDRLREATGCRVGIHQWEAERIENPPADFTFQHGDLLEAGDTVLEVVHTPGHSAGHCCFLLRGHGVLFTGDHILGAGTSIVAPPEGDMAAYMESLSLLLNYPLRILCPGHGPVVWEAREKVLEYLEHRRIREQAVLEGVRMGLGSPETLVPRIYTDVPEFLHGLARYTVEAHLLKLEKEGKIRRASSGQGYESCP
jgi:glyoxylase-like metal-dependent hydrolase (beta-lactamase superfamily II)